MAEHKFEVGDAVEHQGSIGTVLKLDVGIGGQPSALVQFTDSQTWCWCGNLKPATRMCDGCGEIRKVDQRCLAAAAFICVACEAKVKGSIAERKQRAASYSPSASCSDCAKLKRELENLKRSTDSELGDLRSEVRWRKERMQGR